MGSGVAMGSGLITGAGVTTGALGAGEAGSSPLADPRPLNAAAVAIDPPRTSAPTMMTAPVRRRPELVRSSFTCGSFVDIGTLGIRGALDRYEEEPGAILQRRSHPGLIAYVRPIKARRLTYGIEKPGGSDPPGSALAGSG
jgi:hypothetical protein